MKKKGKTGKTRVSRRAVLGMMAMSTAAVCFGCSSKNAARPGRKMLILGFDGMDYNIVSGMLQKGELPNFRKVADNGAFLPLVSSTPPQSPVAWSNFITGKNPGGHAIFDFITRDPKTYLPEFSLSKVTGSEEYVTIAGRKIPLSAGKVELLRKGKAWWNYLEEHGIPATVLNVPSNFPPEKSGQRCISGMGTPDILGTYGTFSFYTSGPVEEGKVQGGHIYHVEAKDGVVEADLLGPENSFLKDKPNVKAPFKVYLDAGSRQAKVAIQEHEIILREGEWSDWLRVSFELVALSSIKGIIRLYLKSVGPEFNLYISPVNIDPENPSVPISTPGGFSAEVADNLGVFYTQGIPEETWALNEGRLNEDEFLEQAALVKNERTAAFRLELERFKRAGQGACFCYWGLTDTGSHMFWCHRDPRHPKHDPAYSPKYSTAIEGFYKEMDKVVGLALDAVSGDTALIIMSDHGFTPFYRAFHVNRWLYENGYLAFVDEFKGESGEFFENVDWSNTRAYAIGLNGLYINLDGREGQGIVSPEEKDGLVGEIIGKLKEARDPDRGEAVVSEAYDAAKIYSGPYKGLAPDVIIGYNTGYRSSWETALGKAPAELIRDNDRKWSGDHCMDPAFVPGIFFCNRGVGRSSLYITDIAPSVLAFFGIQPPADMDGKSFF